MDDATRDALERFHRRALQREAEASTRLDGETIDVGPVTVGPWPQAPSRDPRERAWLEAVPGISRAEVRAMLDLSIEPPLMDYSWRDVLEAYRRGARDAGNGIVARPPLDPGEGRGKWRELVRDLIILIQSGAARRGDLLPSETALMASHEVSRATARKAYDFLEAAGVVETRHGVGRIVL